MSAGGSKQISVTSVACSMLRVFTSSRERNRCSYRLSV